MEAYLKNYRQSPRKFRLVANAVKGKRVPDALVALQYTVKRASDPLAKLVKSAAANASHNFGIPVEMLMVKSLTVNKGIIMKRMMPRARGSGARINKRTCNVHIVLVDVRNPGQTPTKVKAAKAETTPETKAPAKSKAPAKKPAVKKTAKATK